jgi:hypothetical protein
MHAAHAAAASSPSSCMESDNARNAKLYGRNIPSSPLGPAPMLPRAFYTKYEIFPLVPSSGAGGGSGDTTARPAAVPVFNPSTTFNPGTSAPWSGFASNINTESFLRNQVYPRTKYTGAYVWDEPRRSSAVNPPADRTLRSAQPPGGAYRYRDKIGISLFNNSTRQQMRDLTPDEL